MGGDGATDVDERGPSREAHVRPCYLHVFNKIFTVRLLTRKEDLAGVWPQAQPQFQPLLQPQVFLGVEE